jgi:predicted CopG family antitoxin
LVKITIRNDVYRRLKAVKGENESFSDLLNKLLEPQKSLETLKHLRGSVDFKDGEKEKLLSELYASRAERRT